MADSQDRTVAIHLADLTHLTPQRLLVGWLVPLMGPFRYRGDLRVFDGKTLVGTAADCDIVLPDGYLSARHCVLHHEAGNVVVTDLDSRNGTWLNGRRVHRALLVDNDTMRLGRTELKVKLLF